MSDILSAIAEDIKKYEELCERYGEEVRMKDGSPDCYGEHANELRKSDYRAFESQRDAKKSSMGAKKRKQRK